MGCKPAPPPAKPPGSLTSGYIPLAESATGQLTVTGSGLLVRGDNTSYTLVSKKRKKKSRVPNNGVSTSNQLVVSDGTFTTTTLFGIASNGGHGCDPSFTYDEARNVCAIKVMFAELPHVTCDPFPSEGPGLQEVDCYYTPRSPQAKP